MNPSGTWAALSFAWIVLLHACSFPEPEPAPSASPFDAAFVRLSPLEVAGLPPALHFTAPMGAGNGALTYNARPFRTRSHLGDDLNGIGGWNSDLGDPVFASGTGRVVYAGTPSDGWGKMVILAHRVPDASPGTGWRVILTVYAHLQSIMVRHGGIVLRGQALGTVGTADGRYLAHLHFEVRESLSLYPGLGYAEAPLDRLPPEKFLQQHGIQPPDLFIPPPAVMK